VVAATAAAAAAMVAVFFFSLFVFACSVDGVAVRVPFAIGTCPGTLKSAHSDSPVSEEDEEK
jgi:hypothetical protein